MSTNYNKIKKLTLICMLVSLSLVLGLIEIPYPLAPWLKIDISEVIILLTINVLGYRYAIFGIFFRSIIRYFITQQTNIPVVFFGESIAIFNSILLVFLTFLFKDFKKNIYIKYLIIILLQTTIIVFLNYIFITPSYINLKLSFLNKEVFKSSLVKGSYTLFILYTYIPFNLIKNFLVIGLFYKISKSIKDVNFIY